MNEQTINIKEVIELLCHLLHLHNYPKITPEVIRQAKFDRSEATPSLLILINSIIKRSRCETANFNEIISLLSILKYPRLSAVFLCDQENVSSRELLIIFAFLLEETNFFDYLRKEALLILSEKIFQPVSNSLIKQFEISTLNDLIILRKHIDITFKVLFSSARNISKLLSKIYPLSQSLSHLLVQQFEINRLLDLVFLGDIKLQKKILPILTQQISLLKLHSRWLKNEPIFWKWMSSVTKISILLPSNNSSQSIFSQKRESKDDSLKYVYIPKLNVKSAVVHLLRAPLKPFLYDEKKNEEKITDLMNEVQSLKENNKRWLLEFLEVHYPNLVHMDSPRR